MKEGMVRKEVYGRVSEWVKKSMMNGGKRKKEVTDEGKKENVNARKRE